MKRFLPRELKPSYHFIMKRTAGESIGKKVTRHCQASQALEWLHGEFGRPGIWQYRNWFTKAMGYRPIIQQSSWTWSVDVMAEIYYFRFLDKRTAIRFKARFDVIG